MNDETFIPLADDCEASQRQLSDHADSGEALTPELQAHLDACPACARFAAQWLQGPPTELVRPVPAVAASGLRARILDAMDPPNVVRFPGPGAPRAPWTTWLGRIAACLALAGFSYWLLNPAPTPVRPNPATAASAPTLTQSLAQMEDRTHHEQAVLQTALVDGGRQVRGNVAWTVSALEL